MARLVWTEIAIEDLSPPAYGQVRRVRLKTQNLRFRGGSVDPFCRDDKIRTSVIMLL